jgi:hypothetical protein
VNVKCSSRFFLLPFLDPPSFLLAMPQEFCGAEDMQRQGYIHAR